MTTLATLAADEVMARITRRVNFLASGCWEWTGQVNNWGYGMVSVDGRKQGVHRLIYALLVDDPEGMVIDHTCRNRICVNPSHLQAVTHGENVGLSRTRRTHCPQGHEYTDENTYITAKDHRQCRTCRLSRVREQNLRRKERT
jgi:hypothetical protein